MDLCLGMNMKPVALPAGVGRGPLFPGAPATFLRSQATAHTPAGLSPGTGPSGEVASLSPAQLLTCPHGTLSPPGWAPRCF